MRSWAEEGCQWTPDYDGNTVDRLSVSYNVNYRPEFRHLDGGCAHLGKLGEGHMGVLCSY